MRKKIVKVHPVSLLRQNQIVLNEWQLVMKCGKIKEKLKGIGKYHVCSAIRRFVVVVN